MPKTAIIGACGLVGRELFNYYRTSYPDLIGTDWKGREAFLELDLAKVLPNLNLLAETNHTWIAICAGLKNFAHCERERDYAWRSNVEGTLNLARKAHEIGIRVLYFSSDIVYGGESAKRYDESSPLQIINEYGRHKIELEKELPKVTGGSCLTLRIGRVIGVKRGDGTLLDEIATKLMNGEPVVAAYDQRFNPILVDDLPAICSTLQSLGCEGAYNVGGSEALSRYEIAASMAEKLGVPIELVRKISLDEIGDGIVRPKDLSMNCDKLYAALGFTPKTISECMSAVISKCSSSQNEPKERSKNKSVRPVS